MAGFYQVDVVLQKERNQVLSCSKEDIRKTADVIRTVVSKESMCVIGNEKHIKEEGQLFESIKTLS